MTDLDLQDAIIQEIKGLAKRQSLKKLNDEVWTDYSIYRQDKPYKDDNMDAEQEDYIIVMLDDEDTDFEGRWIVTVHIIISIMLYEEQHQGNLILANLMNQIDMHFRKKGLIARKYEMEKEAYKRFNHECYPNYYECDLITKWKLPEIHQEGIGELI